MSNYTNGTAVNVDSPRKNGVKRKNGIAVGKVEVGFDEMRVGITFKSEGPFFTYNVTPPIAEEKHDRFIVASLAKPGFYIPPNTQALIQENTISFVAHKNVLPHNIYPGNKSIDQLKLWYLSFNIPNTVVLDFSFYELYLNTNKVSLRDVYDKLISNRLGPLLAIRCAGNLEDSEDKSFAGTFDTYLNVPNNFAEFEQKILQSFKRFSSDKNILSEFRKHGLRLGVMVQNMVKAKYTGFLFTTDPMDPPSEQATTDPLDPANERAIVEYWKGEREKSAGSSLILNKLNGRIIENDGKGCKIPLSVNIKNKLYTATKKLDKYFNFPQDAEFLVSQEDNQLYLVQTRPITAFSYSPEKVRQNVQEELSRVWDKNRSLYDREPILSSTNISELFIRAIPLGYSIFKHGFAGTKEKEGGISIGRFRLGYAKLDLEDQVYLFYTVGDQARVNLIVDSLTFRLPAIEKADYLKFFVDHYLEEVQQNQAAAIYPENGLYLQFDDSERWLEIAGEKGAAFQEGYSDFLEKLIGHHAPKEYDNASRFFKENELEYRTRLSKDLLDASSDYVKNEIESLLEYLRKVFCPQYVVFARLAFLCTHVAKQKLDTLLDTSVPLSSDHILNELLESIVIPQELESPNYPYFEHLFRKGKISVFEFLNRFQHLGSLDINQPRLGDYSIDDLSTIFGQNKNYDHGDERISMFTRVKGLEVDLAVLGLEGDPNFKDWYTFAGRFMRIRERAKFELLKILYALKRLIKKFAELHHLSDLIFYMESDELLDVEKKNREHYRMLALQRKARFEASQQFKLKDVVWDSDATPFEENQSDYTQIPKKDYKVVSGTTIYYGRVEGVCLVAESNDEYLRKLKAYRDKNENIIGIFKGVELSYFSLGSLSGFTTQNGGYLSHAATIAREFRLPYITGIDIHEFADGDHVILDTENNQVIYKELPENGKHYTSDNEKESVIVEEQSEF